MRKRERAYLDPDVCPGSECEEPQESDEKWQDWEGREGPDERKAPVSREGLGLQGLQTQLVETPA